MPREYQAESSEQTQPHDQYMEIIWKLKGYPRRKREVERLRMDVIYSTPDPGTPRGPGVGDPTANKAIRIAKLTEEVDAIDRAIHDFNAYYENRMKRDDVDGFDTLSAFEDYGYFAFMLYNPKTKKHPARITWQRFRTRFAYDIASNLKLI